MRGDPMKTKAIRMVLIIAAGSALFSILLTSSHMSANGPASIDMSAVIKELSKNASFEYSFISADQLKRGTIVWQQPVPSKVRGIWGLGPENLLVVCEKDLPSPSPYVKPHEETLLIFKSSGNLLVQEFIGEYSVRNVHQSHDGSLVSIETERDHDIINIVTDFNASGFLRIGYHSVLLPSWNGEYLINKSSRRTGNTSTLVIDAGGREKRVPSVRLLNKDGSAREAGMASSLQEESKGVLGAFANGELLLSGCDSAGLDCALTLYNADEGRMIWTRGVPPLTSIEAICNDSAHSRTYLLMNPAANEHGVQSFVIAKEDGEFSSEVQGSGVWNSIGSNDGHFYSIFSEEPPPEQRPKYKFILKHTPEFTIESYGVLCEYHSLHSMKLYADYLYGTFENCPIDGRTISLVTALFNMGANSAPIGSNGIPSKGVKPVVLEGNWYVRNITTNEVELIGQLDPSDGYLTRITIQRSWLE